MKTSHFFLIGAGVLMLGVCYAADPPRAPEKSSKPVVVTPAPKPPTAPIVNNTGKHYIAPTPSTGVIHNRPAPPATLGGTAPKTSTGSLNGANVKHQP